MIEARIASTSTITPHFTQPDGTASPTPDSATSVSERSARVAQWLASPQARAFDGRWVLLSDTYDAVVDHDDSARELSQRHADRADPLIVYVQPPRFHFDRLSASATGCSKR